MGIIINALLPNSEFKLSDGKQYEPPDFVKKFLSQLMDLDTQEYQRVRMYLAPFKFFTEINQLAGNPLLATVYHHMIMEDYYAYRAAFTPPPVAKVQ